jgi:hypothetical protein
MLALVVESMALLVARPTLLDRGVRQGQVVAQGLVLVQVLLVVFSKTHLERILAVTGRQRHRAHVVAAPGPARVAVAVVAAVLLLLLLVVLVGKVLLPLLKLLETRATLATHVHRVAQVPARVAVAHVVVLGRFGRRRGRGPLPRRACAVRLLLVVELLLLAPLLVLLLLCVFLSLLSCQSCG